MIESRQVTVERTHHTLIGFVLTYGALNSDLLKFGLERGRELRASDLLSSAMDQLNFLFFLHVFEVEVNIIQDSWVSL